MAHPWHTRACPFFAQTYAEVDRMQDLIEAQNQIEAECLDLGYRRYQLMRAAGESSLPPGQRILKTYVSQVALAIKEFTEAALAGTPGRNTGQAYFLQQFGPNYDLVAFVTVRAVIDSFAFRAKLPEVAARIGTLLEDQVNHDNLKEIDKRAYTQLTKKLRTSPAGFRHVLLTRAHRRLSVKRIKWGNDERVRVGTALLEIAQSVTQAFEIRTIHEGNKAGPGKYSSPTYILPTQETLDWLAEAHARVEWMSPVTLPMVVPPRRWSRPWGGGYLNAKMRYPLIKGAPAGLLHEMEEMDMGPVYTAVNALQETAWAVNSGILGVLRHAWDNGLKIAKLPPSEPEGIPTKDFTEEEAKARATKFMEWKSKAAKAHAINARLGTKRVQINRLIWAADKLSEFPAIYYPHALDFRGRAYAVGAFLNPQGTDMAKGLLRFSRAVPLGESGAYWMAVHGANTYGVDKVSFEERVQWVVDHESEILDSGLRPLEGDQFWTTADAPWQFLAWCIEWSALHLHTTAGHPQETFESRLPVGLDGTCNGLQNFSAMLRDPVGAAATNLLPADKPSDIYAQVAARANAIIDADVISGVNDRAPKWAGKMTRSLCKRNTMTTPYAVTRYGMQQQLWEEFQKAINDGEDVDEVIRTADIHDVTYLAAVNWRAIGDVVFAARSAMDWLQSVARVVAQEGLPVRWRTPMGFWAVQNYREVIGKRLDFVVLGERMRITLSKIGEKVDKRRQASGIAPNFVHSLDAAHLQRTVGYCLQNGITDFAMVHDSFGTHAGNIEGLSFYLRQAFVDQYSEDILADFRQQMVDQVSPEVAEKIPPCPPMGTLDLQAVMQSHYFFA